MKYGAHVVFAVLVTALLAHVQWSSIAHVVVAAQRPTDDPSLVMTDAGLVRGEIGTGFRAFKGIPFADPPTGEQRWRPPVPRSPWQGTLNATQWGKQCPQSCSLPIGFCPTEIDEDCLRLNVFTPLMGAHNSTNLLPVFVFIPGGHFDAGGAGVPAYDGRFLAMKGVIVVSINYRLGVLGYMVHKNHGIHGNFGSMDQVLALQWVKKNIRAFGGDPNRVTLGGESAGGTSVSALHSAPAARGLFHRAIVQSNPFSLVLLEIDQAHKLGKAVEKEVKCKDLACLKSTPWQTLVSAQNKVGNKPNFLHPILTLYPWTPVIDGVYCTGQPIEMYSAGEFHEMPLMIGSLSEEALMFVYLALEKPASKLVFNAAKAALFLKRYSSVNSRYPSISGDNRIPMSELATDYIFTAPTRNVAINVARLSKAPVYLFQFNHSLSFEDAWLPSYPFCRGHVCHGSELPFTFNSTSLVGFDSTLAEKRLTDAMMTYWANFITTGDPSQGTPISPRWPVFSGDNLFNMQFELDNIHVKKGLSAEICDFWDEMGYKWGWNLFGKMYEVEDDYISIFEDGLDDDDEKR